MNMYDVIMMSRLEYWLADLFEKIYSYTLNELERILGTPLPLAAKSQVLQPISFCGVGLPSAVYETRRNRLIQSEKISISEKVQHLKGFEFINELPTTVSAPIVQTVGIQPVPRRMRQPQYFS